MAEETAAPLLKEIFNLDRLKHIARETAALAPGFDERRFVKLASNDLAALSIMQRLRQVATSLNATLPGDFPSHVQVLHALAPRINHGFASIALPEYVALYGQDHFDLSMQALRHLTRFGSSEFAIRAFLARDLPRTLAVMQEWSRNDNEHVRRLASEGCRPRLPWSFQLKELIADPAPAAPILDALKRDDSLYVRKSVANHLNDIGKDHPDWMLERVSGWPRDDARTAWIVRHALRTMIKNGNPRALKLIGVAGKADVRVDAFEAEPASIRLGDRLRIAATLTSTQAENQRLVVDYAIHYVKKSGAASRKVFKWKELDLVGGGAVDLSISQVVRDFTTRKHHAGRHRIELLVNGAVMTETGFDLHL